MEEEAWEQTNEVIRRNRRFYLKRMFGRRGYKKCALCDSPVRPVIRIDPASNMIVSRGGIEVKLRMLCEVCWRENKGRCGDDSDTHIVLRFGHIFNRYLYDPI